MKKMTWLAVFILLFMVLAACRGDDLEEVEAVLSIDDIILVEGQSHIITYTITPSYLLSHDVDITYLIMDQSPRGYGVISMSDHHLGRQLVAQEAGTATIKAVAVNTLGSDYVFHAETTFTVTVVVAGDEDHEHVRNGSFDDGLEAWHIDFLQPYVEYDLDKPANHAHSSEHALFVEFSNHHQSEVPLTFTLSQLIADVPAGTYLFSLWYKGTVFSLTMTVWFEDWVVSTYTFRGDNYDDVPGHNGYVNFIIEAYVEVASDLTIVIEIVGNNIEGSEEIWFWSYVDSISFREGFIDQSYLMPMGWKED